ncbi:MAG TPA: SMC-Scp complex subunit ScpB [Candidatus Thermoplasmatota archaeon]|nr:SMC-Scp complex subunit ScpB [Candidatus Thermoplasmatota archaeon]
MNAEAATEPANPPHAGHDAAPATPAAHHGAFGTKKAALHLVKGMKPVHVVEAALFAAGKPVSVEEIQNETGLEPDAIRKAAKELQKAYEERETVLEVQKAGAKWAMQVRRAAAEPAARFAAMEIAPKLLKTLALIAYHQPMKQSELVEMIGSKVYEHVPELTERGLVRAREEGVTKILTTTPAFPEYFGLDADDREAVRSAMAKLVGLPPPPPKREAERATAQETLEGGPRAPTEGPQAAFSEAPESPPTPPA